MKRSSYSLGGLALALLFALPTAGRADLIAWSYNWSRSPSEIHADSPGTGKITLTDESQHNAVGDSDVVATNMRTFSDALPAQPDHFTNAPYSLTLTLKDQVSGQTGSMTFTGEINGDLGAQFALDLVRLRVGDDCGFFQRQVAVAIEQRRYRVDRAHRRPPEAGPLAVHRQVDAEVRVRMRRRKARHLGKPRARHEDAGRGDPAFLERLERRAVDGMRHAEIVGMDHQ